MTVRKQDVGEFADDAGFDVAWLPAPFIPQAAIGRGLPRVAAALRPGGWLILGHGKLGGIPVEDAVTRLKTIAYGGTALDEAAACHLLSGAGLTSVRLMPTPARGAGHHHRPEASMTTTAVTPSVRGVEGEPPVGSAGPGQGMTRLAVRLPSPAPEPALTWT